MRSIRKPIRLFVTAILSVVLLGILSSCANVSAQQAKETSSQLPSQETSPAVSEETTSAPQAPPPAVYSELLDSFRAFATTVVDANDHDSFRNSFDIPEAGLEKSNWGKMLNGLCLLWGDTGLPYQERSMLNLSEVLRQVLGYAVNDLNGDGIPELVILSKQYKVVGVFTLVENQPYLLDGYWDRYRCAILTSGELYTFSSGGAYDSYYTVQQIEKGSTKLLTIEEYGIESCDEQGRRLQAPRYYKIIDNKKSIISESEYNEFHKRYPSFGETTAQKITKNSGLQFVPLFK